VSIPRKSKGSDHLVLALASFFKSSNAADDLDDTVLQDAIMRQFSNQSLQVSKDTLADLGNQGSVEVVKLIEVQYNDCIM
jgi:hypothetical protein